MDPNNQVVIVSMRLPVSVSKTNTGLSFTQSSGGLATAVGSTDLAKNSIWVGWPGIASDNLTKNDKQEIKIKLKSLGCRPVFLSQAQIDSYYSGYSNATLWPILHYFPSRTKFDKEFWRSYKKVNSLFAKSVKAVYENGAKIWVHDYQLMLLPNLLRSAHPKAQIGFFLHTPFPSYEIFRLIPERKQLLEGLLGADLIGFHTYDYVTHFLNSVLRLDGRESLLGLINVNGRKVKADAFPIGIDYKKFAISAKNKQVKKILESFNLFSEKTKVILSVDRTDYSKGIPERLAAIEHFIKYNPQYLGKVVFVILAIPSRGGIEAYDELRLTIEQKISRINGEFSTVDWSPIIYRHQHTTFDTLTAMYSLADVMLVTPLRDGMNLVAKEYVATKHKDKGVLILSETAGVATELPDALLVNPNDYNSIADALKLALQMPGAEQKQRMRQMQARVAEYTAQKWAEDFMIELEHTTDDSGENSKYINPKQEKEMTNSYSKAHSRLILLDYDGTLRSFVRSPKAELAKPSAKINRIIKKLVADKHNKVVIVSGRSKSTLASYFNEKSLDLIAEHGGWIFNTGHWVKPGLTSSKWKKSVKSILLKFASRTPGAIVEEKDFSMVWHYRNVSPDLAYVRTEELKMQLQNVIDTKDIGVFDGKKSIEIKPRRLQKGALVTEIVSDNQWDFIMAIGDDNTDEDMFMALPERAYTIKVGAEQTNARFALHDASGVITLLELLSKN